MCVCVCVCVCVLVTQVCPILYDPMDCIARQAPLSTGFLRQEHWTGLVFPTQELNPSLLHCKWILYH